jgi:hypothetical protein
MPLSPPSTPINWDSIREALPGTAHDLLDEVRAAFEESSDNPARAVERVLLARLTDIRTRFEQLRGEER